MLMDPCFNYHLFILQPQCYLLSVVSAVILYTVHLLPLALKAVTWSLPQPRVRQSLGVIAAVSFEGFQNYCSAKPISLSKGCPFVATVNMVMACWDQYFLCKWDRSFYSPTGSSLTLLTGSAWRVAVWSTLKQITFSDYSWNCSREDRVGRCILCLHNKIPNGKIYHEQKQILFPFSWSGKTWN